MNKVIFYQKDGSQVPAPLKDFEQVENVYVRIYGEIRVFKDERAIVGHFVKKVEKMDEMTNHLLQVFVASNIRTKGVLAKEQMDNKGAKPAAPRGGGKDVQATVLDLMKEVTKNNRFAHRNDLWTICQNQMSHQDFKNSLDALMEDGAIYTAIGDDQFGVTDA